ncbi:MAG TPA: glycolate oxidase subunit GlcE [Gammaproteobacteria bacterium]|nr:glycolate oxidase subunit GlcE [Gammaproteobacteria bacterium]
MKDQDLSQDLQIQVQQALQQQKPLSIQGGNSKSFYGRPVEGETLDVSGHQGIIAYEPTELAITVRAGTPLNTLEALLDEQQQQLPFEPPNYNGQATIGGVVAAGLSGPRRPYAGSVRDSVLGVKIINGQGQILEFGGRVMKNVAGYDVSRLMVGAMGTLGLLLEISFKLRPQAEQEITLSKALTPDQARQEWRKYFGQATNLSATAYDGQQLLLRLSGGSASVAALHSRIGGDLIHDGATTWAQLKNHQTPFFNKATTLWRITQRPASPLHDFPGKQQIEWNGGLLWLNSDAPAEEIHQLACKHGGHAILFRAADIPSTPFPPLPPALFRLHQKVKASLDPQGIFNPGKLYPDL